MILRFLRWLGIVRPATALEQIQDGAQAYIITRYGTSRGQFDYQDGGHIYRRNR